MGEKVNNVEIVKDYSTGKSYVRLHMDCPVSDEIATELAALLESGNIRNAFALLSDNTATHDPEIIEVFATAHDRLRKMQMTRVA